MTRAALESESSGYFLVPADQAVATWRPVDAAEAAAVRGMGNTQQNEMGATTDEDVKTKRNHKNCGMCDYNMHDV